MVWCEDEKLQSWGESPELQAALVWNLKLELSTTRETERARSLGVLASVKPALPLDFSVV